MTKSKTSFWKKYKDFVYLCGICILIFLAVQLLIWSFLTRPNEFGDTTGFINGLFSALAFAGVIYAIILQRKELELQREELAHTREELEGQKAEFKTQNETLRRQRFENTFFNLMQQQLLISDNISISYIENESKTIGQNGMSQISERKGREVFRTSFEDVAHHDEDGTIVKGFRELLAKNGFKGYVESFTPTYFDHYFRHIYRILKYIDKTQLIPDEDKYEYAAILRSQFSRYELIWLYYNGLSEYGVDKFKPLIEKYAILKNLRKDMLVQGLDIDVKYNPSAFGKINSTVEKDNLL